MLITFKEASVSESLQYYFCIAIISIILLLFFSAFSSYSFSFESLKTLTKESQGLFSSIIMMVAVAPWAYIGFDNIPQTAEEFNFPPN
jgi:amino acid transporter